MRHFVMRGGAARPALRMRIGAVLLTLALTAILVPAAGALPTCTDTFTGASGGDWGTAGNWSSGVPTSAKVACWSAAATVVISAGATADSIQGGSLNITGGSLS